MERKGTQPTFMDGYVADLGDPKMAAKLDQLDRRIPWQKLAAPIRATYDNDSEQGGRPNVAVEWFNAKQVRLRPAMPEPPTPRGSSSRSLTTTAHRNRFG